MEYVLSVCHARRSGRGLRRTRRAALKSSWSDERKKKGEYQAYSPGPKSSDGPAALNVASNMPLKTPHPMANA